MSFLKDNWSRLCIALLTGGAAIYAFVLCVSMPSFDFMAFCGVFGPFAFFAGTCAHIICKMFKKTKVVSKFILFGSGMIATIFLAIVWVDSFGMYKDLKQFSTWAAGAAVFAPTAVLIVMGLTPFIRGSKKILAYYTQKEDEEKAATAAKAEAAARAEAEARAKAEAEAEAAAAAAKKQRKPREVKPKVEQPQEQPQQNFEQPQQY